MARKKTKSPKKRTQKAGVRDASLRRYVAIWGVSALIVFITAWAVLAMSTPDPEFNEAAIEGVLIAADVNLETDVTKRTKASTRHWRIDVGSPAKKRTLMEALEKLTHASGGVLVDRQRKSIEDNHYHLVDLELKDAPKLSLLLVVPDRHTELRKSHADIPSADRDLAEDSPRPKIAIILDDVGGHPVDYLSDILALRYPITFSVLPFLAYSTRNAIFLHQNHYQVMLHLPMEPFDYPERKPGPGAVFCHMNDEEIAQAIDRALRNVPFACGVNNHMGSKVTANRTMMTSILTHLEQRHLFFVDSRTHDSTVAYETAKSMGVPAGERRVFLDSERTFEFSTGQLEVACQKADEEGQVIVIGHVYPTTLEALIARMPEIDRRGYQFVFADDLLQASEDHL